MKLKKPTETVNIKQKGNQSMTNLNDNNSIPFKTRHSIRLRKGIVNNEPSKTKQSFAEESDINNVLKRYAATGSLPTNIKENPQYGDYSTVSDYQTSLNIIQKAQDQFYGLPSSLRDRLQNDPQQFLDFVADPKNSEELIHYGLKNKPIEKKELPVPKKENNEEN